MNSSPAYDAVFTFFTSLTTDARTLNLIRTFVNAGYRIAVIAQGTEEDKAKFESENFTFLNIKYSGFNKFSYKWLQYHFSARKYIKSAKADKYFAMDLYSLSLARKLAKKYKARLFYDSREIYSALGPLAGRNIKQNLLSRWEKQLVKHVDDIIVSGELDAGYLKNNLRNDIPYHVIMNLPFYREAIESEYIRKKFNISTDKIILLYQGMLLPGRGIQPIFKALKYLDNAVFVLFGEGYYSDELEKQAAQLGIGDRVIFAGTADYDMLHEITCSADIGLVLIEPISLSYNLALPNKLFEYCMAGIPSLASNLPAMKKIIDNYSIGICIEHNSAPDKIAESIIELYKKKSIFRKNCLDAAKTLNYEIQTNAILKLMEKK